jgi:hypothetical protein
MGLIKAAPAKEESARGNWRVELNIFESCRKTNGNYGIEVILWGKEWEQSDNRRLVLN